MSRDAEREQRLDDELRALTRRVVGTAPPAVPFEELAVRRAPRRARLAVGVAAAVLVVAAIGGALALGRARQGTVVASPGGAPIELRPLGPAELVVADRRLPGIRFTIDGGGEMAAAVTADELCAQPAGESSPSCSRRLSVLHYAIVFDGERNIVVAAVPEGTAVAVITVEGRPNQQVPAGGIVGFVLPGAVTDFKIETYDASGARTASAAT
jgi:hypothetical protein